MESGSADRLFETLSLTEYEATALEELLRLGRTTAPNLAEATGIPKARIYGVLDSLAEDGYIKVVPSRPKEYHAKPPEEILDRAVENRRQAFEQYSQNIEAIRETFLSEFRPVYETASDDITPAEELFHVVDVGEPSEQETRRLYHEAESVICVITNSFAYIDAVESELSDALDRGVEANLLFLNPDLMPPEKSAVQAEIIDRLADAHPDLAMRYSEHKLPLRGTLIDPSMDYDAGQSILLVEEPDVPNHMRQAAITENGSFVAGLKRYFDLVWEYDSTAVRD